MTRSRIASTALLCAGLFGLAACDSAAPEAAAPAPATASSAPAAATTAGDKTLCRTVHKAASDMRAGISNVQQADGSVKPADAKKAFGEFGSTVGEALTSSAASDVTVAAQAVADEIAQAAATADPIGTAADSDFAKLSEDLTTACEAAGVTIYF